MISFPPGTEMFQFPGLPPHRLCIQRRVTWHHPGGVAPFGHPGSKPAGGSPGLFAAIHVLHRLLVPRHPPCALASSASRSFEFTKPAGSMFSKKPLLGTSLGQEVPSVCICLLNYSSILQVHYQRSAEHQSWSLDPLDWVEPPRPALRDSPRSLIRSFVLFQFAVASRAQK